MKDKECGFTVIEVVVVIAIVGISVAIAVPNMMGLMSGDRLKGATRQVMGDFMWARMQAVTQKNEFRIFFINEHEYTILDDDNNDGRIDPGEWMETKNIRDRYADVSLSSTVNPIFFPRGSASTGTVTLTNPGGFKKVKVHLTGRVKTV